MNKEMNVRILKKIIDKDDFERLVKAYTIESRTGTKSKRPTKEEIELLYSYIDGDFRGKELADRLKVSTNALGSRMRSIAYRLVYYERYDGKRK